jgi:hypothetical protein
MLTFRVSASTKGLPATKKFMASGLMLVIDMLKTWLPAMASFTSSGEASCEFLIGKTLEALAIKLQRAARKRVIFMVVVDKR